MRRLPIHRLRTTGVALAVALGVVVVDALTKAWARSLLAHQDHHVVGPLWWRLGTNQGFSFSLGHSSPTLAVTLSLLALVGATIATAYSAPGLASVGFGLLLGGGLANLIDRTTSATHAVTDFIAVGSFPVFNVADMAVTVGLVLLAGVLATGGRLWRTK